MKVGTGRRRAGGPIGRARQVSSPIGRARQVSSPIGRARQVSSPIGRAGGPVVRTAGAEIAYPACSVR
jgi:hypothetical protein